MGIEIKNMELIIKTEDCIMNWKKNHIKYILITMIFGIIVVTVQHPL